MRTFFTAFLTLILFSTNTHAHRSGCHSQHSCPSDNNSYVCGDTGNCSQCPDNIYCKDNSPRNKNSKPPLFSTSKHSKYSNNPSNQKPLLRKVTRVVDGDTIVLDGNERIRLIGVDTPETVHPKKPVEYFGKEASDFTKRMVEGKQVRLESYKRGSDKYGRSLAYVYLEDGTCLNAEIIKQGYGFAYTKFPFEKMEKFRKYEREAREQKKGLWKK